MKKLGLVFKETSENLIKHTLKESSAVFVIKYSGLSSPQITTLRRNLRSQNANLFVVKNSVARRALGSLALEPLVKHVEGPCGLVFIKEEPVGTSRVLCNFLKEHEQLKLEGGYLKDRLLTEKDIESMALLPSREILRHRLVLTLNSPILGLAIVLNLILKNFVYCLEQIRKKKES